MLVWARFISVLFHPLFVQQYLLILMLNHNRFLLRRLEADQRLGLLLIMFVSLFVLPLLLSWWLAPTPRSMLRLVHQDKDARNKSLAVLMILLMLHYIIFNLSAGFEFLSVYLASALFCGLICMLFQQFFRISLHAAAAGSVPAFLLFLMPFASHLSWYWLPIALLLSWMIIWSRYRLRAHGLSELAAGYLVGFCSIYLIFAMHYGI